MEVLISACEHEQQSLNFVGQKYLKLVGDSVAESSVQSPAPLFVCGIVLEDARDEHMPHQADGLGSAELAIDADNLEEIPGKREDLWECVCILGPGDDILSLLL